MITQRMLHTPIIPEGGRYHRLIDGELQTEHNTVALGAEILRRLAGSDGTLKTEVVFFQDPESKQYKIRIYAIIGEHAIKTGAISESLAALETYFGVQAPAAFKAQVVL